MCDAAQLRHAIDSIPVGPSVRCGHDTRARRRYPSAPSPEEMSVRWAGIRRRLSSALTAPQVQGMLVANHAIRSPARGR